MKLKSLATQFKWGAQVRVLALNDSGRFIGQASHWLKCREIMKNGSMLLLSALPHNLASVTSAVFTILNVW